MRETLLIIKEDFSEELDALVELSTFGKGSDVLSRRARIAVANSLTLLLASVFEEFVRQLVKAAFNELRQLGHGFDAFPKLQSRIWKTALERAARRSFEDVSVDTRFTRDEISQILMFCLDSNVLANVDDVVAHNDNNMRPEELGRLFGRIGVKDAFGAACSRAPVIDYFLTENGGQATVAARAALEDFFERRNGIAHALAIGSSSGPTNISKDIDMIRVLGFCLAEAVDLKIN